MAVVTLFLVSLDTIEFLMGNVGFVLELKADDLHHVLSHTEGNHVTKNKLRTATIWMDEFGYLVKVRPLKSRLGSHSIFIAIKYGGFVCLPRGTGGLGQPED